MAGSPEELFFFLAWGGIPRRPLKADVQSLTHIHCLTTEPIPQDNRIITASWENKKTFWRNWQGPFRSDMCSSARPWQNAWEPLFWWWVEYFCLSPAGCCVDLFVQVKEENRINYWIFTMNSSLSHCKFEWNRNVSCAVELHREMEERNC